MKHIILAPHLDDEIIGCYSILNKVTHVVYFTDDYRTDNVKKYIHKYKFKYIYYEDFDFSLLTSKDTIYLPSKYDHHPLHKKVRNEYITLPCDIYFYSVEMNVPWLEEETDPKGKLQLLKDIYPGEDLFLKNDKYWIFKSIKKYDDLEFFKYDMENFTLTIDTLIDYNALESFNSLPYDMKTYRTIQSYYPYNTIEIENNYNKIK